MIGALTLGYDERMCMWQHIVVRYGEDGGQRRRHGAYEWTCSEYTQCLLGQILEWDRSNEDALFEPKPFSYIHMCKVELRQTLNCDCPCSDVIAI